MITNSDFNEQLTLVEAEEDDWINWDDDEDNNEPSVEEIIEDILRQID